MLNEFTFKKRKKSLKSNVSNGRISLVPKYDEKKNTRTNDE